VIPAQAVGVMTLFVAIDLIAKFDVDQTLGRHRAMPAVPFNPFVDHHSPPYCAAIIAQRLH
jgi:hypothetical protein